MCLSLYTNLALINLFIRNPSERDLFILSPTLIECKRQADGQTTESAVSRNGPRQRHSRSLRAPRRRKHQWAHYNRWRCLSYGTRRRTRSKISRSQLAEPNREIRKRGNTRQRATRGRERAKRGERNAKEERTTTTRRHFFFSNSKMNSNA